MTPRRRLTHGSRLTTHDPRLTPGARRVHIIGGPASGKTTLACQLGERLGLPMHHLDAIAFEGGGGAPRPLAARREAVNAIREQPDWIVEGTFLGWTAELLRDADLIVWLDLPWTLAARRFTLRHLRGGWLGTAQLSPLRRAASLRKLLGFLGYIRRYARSTSAAENAEGEFYPTRAATATHLAPFSAKVAHLRSPGEVQAMLGANTGR